MHFRKVKRIWAEFFHICPLLCGVQCGAKYISIHEARDLSNLDLAAAACASAADGLCAILGSEENWADHFLLRGARVCSTILHAIEKSGESATSFIFLRSE